HVLIAEDNEANQELIKIVLKRYGLSYDLAKNGLEALELFKQKRYDLILMDEQMPVMDGTEAVRKIIEYEEDKGLRHTPISALTANVIKGAKERDLLIGFDAFLGKPIVLKDLERVFATYLRQDTYVREERLHKAEQKKEKKVYGVDVTQLKKELMLTQEELLILLELFIRKMEMTLPELYEAIKLKDYKKIALKAHSIKGSSGNFRIDELRKMSTEMEQMAKSNDEVYNYEFTFEKIKRRIADIKIV
ncbi:MAG: response regulator, partial [Sulfurimonas sp.]